MCFRVADGARLGMVLQRSRVRQASAGSVSDYKCRPPVARYGMNVLMANEKEFGIYSCESR